VDHGLHTPELTRTSKLVSSLTGYGVQKNKAVVGAERLRARVRHPPARRAGRPADLRDHEVRGGRRRRVADRARQALRPARVLRQAVDDARLRARRRRSPVRLRPVQGARGPQGEVSSEDVRAIVIAETHEAADDYELVSLRVGDHAGRHPSRRRRRRRRQIRRREAGDVVTAEETGDGMVDAACGAIRRAVGRDEVRLVSFQVSAVTGGNRRPRRGHRHRRGRGRRSASRGAACPPTSSRRARRPTSTP
jgi:2-isopropylmalate synthase